MDGSLYYVHQDHLGSTVALSNDTGQPMGWVQYDPYGEVITSTLPITLTDRFFTGQRFDSSTGLYYYNARYYDPHLGRFIQPDTLVPDPLNPQAWNRFSYCYNNPLRFVDPTGHGGPGDWLTGQFIEMGRSGDAGRALVVSAAEAIHHVNWQTQKVFYPDPNTSTADRFWACVEIGGGSVLAAAATAELAFGTLTTAALSGGTAEVATTVGTATTAACADGDCTNEANVAVQTAQSAAQTAQSVWRLNPLQRGVAVENMLGRSPELTQNFPVIDRFQNGIATSIKSIDLGAASYQNIGTLTSKVTGYINTLANWQGARWGDTAIRASQITGRELLLAIPPGATEAQMAALQQLQQWATTVGVTLNTTVIP